MKREIRKLINQINKNMIDKNKNNKTNNQFKAKIKGNNAVLYHNGMIYSIGTKVGIKALLGEILQLTK